jgi:hypothetical protein
VDIAKLFSSKIHNAPSTTVSAVSSKARDTTTPNQSKPSVSQPASTEHRESFAKVYMKSIYEKTKLTGYLIVSSALCDFGWMASSVSIAIRVVGQGPLPFSLTLLSLIAFSAVMSSLHLYALYMLMK